MIEKIQPGSLTDSQGPAADNQVPMSRWKIGILWAFMSLAVVVFSAYITGAIIGLVRYFSPGMMAMVVPLSIGVSIFHPGGWLSLIGLGFALKRRNYRWLYLSGAGAIITGIATAILIGAGLGTVTA